MRKSFNSKKFAARRIRKNARRQACYSETIERKQVERTQSGKYGENSGDPAYFWSHQSPETQIGVHAPGPARALQCLSICVFNRPVRSRQVKSTLRLTAEMIENLIALSGVAYEKLGAIFPSLVAPTPAPTAAAEPDARLQQLLPFSLTASLQQIGESAFRSTLTRIC